ncbi:MAG: sigma-54-dependent Fis family transcriptional regulator [Chloracidobacterium sp.]|nr:sigma-54-dependent Fis family transcriptional regulator [Chloracidobacterium sp.]
MKRILLAWLGNTDLKASSGNEKAELGPIGLAITSRAFDQIDLLSNHSKAATVAYVKWIHTLRKISVRIHYENLSRPNNYEEIYRAALRVVDDTIRESSEKIELTFHLSPGTPAMTAIWIILAKTRFPAHLIETSLQEGIRDTKIPFEIAAEFIPDLLRDPDRALQERTAAPPPSAPEFSVILHKSGQMTALIDQAQKVAVRGVPVLIEGESGTGKELLARAIHGASPRHNSEFVAVNCGAIPSELVESELFGHKKGSFTGAIADRVGFFGRADGGTLFLDEVGDLPLGAQVKLLRVLQEGEITPVGSARAKKVDVRIVSATNRNLLSEVQRGTFREDLFFRLAVIVLRIPALREREGDVGLLIDALWKQQNEEADSLLIPKKELSTGARNVLLRHSWPGNVRELQNTLTRLAVTSSRKIVTKAEAGGALLGSFSNERQEILDRRFEPGFSLSETIGEVASHYLERALKEAGGNKSAASKLLGMANYQTLKNWLRKYNIPES